jgi:Skp family chaperone for outer membrane proteins
MSVQPWEPRFARLEGAFEQVADRLNGMDHRLETMEAKIDHRFEAVDRRFETIDTKIEGLRGETFANFDRLRDEMNHRFQMTDSKIDGKIDGVLKTMIGWMTAQTAVMLTALAAVAFSLHH